MTTASASYPDKNGILLSTLWRQDSKNGTEYEFNMFCPENSLAGCVAVAGAQILYYWLGKGADIRMALDDRDAYTSTSGDVVIKIDGSEEGASKYGYLDFNTLSHYLGDLYYNTDNPNRDVKRNYTIAALCFACGVLDKSDYSTISTAAFVTDTVYSRAAFDGHSCLSVYDIDSDSGDVHFDYDAGTGEYTFSDAFYEVMADNIASGCPMLFGMDYPGHAVVIDGYDASSDTFHINYGWGLKSSKSLTTSGYYSGTGWYSRDEIKLNSPTDIVFDIVPVYDGGAITVSSSGTYGSGTLFRAIEKARNISGGNTVLFTPETRGMDLSFAGLMNISNGDLAVKDFSAAVGAENDKVFAVSKKTSLSIDSVSGDIAAGCSYSKAYIFRNNYATASVSVDSLSGNLVVNSRKGGSVFYGKGSVSVSADGGNIYAGAYKASGSDYYDSIVTVISALEKFRTDGDIALSAVGAYASGWALNTGKGSANDVFTIKGNSAVLGGLSFGKGSDSLYIEGGSVLYGDIRASGTLDVTFKLNGDASNAFVTVKNSVGTFSESADGILKADISSAFNGKYTLIDGAADADAERYLRSFSVKVVSGSYKKTLSLAGTSSCRYAALSYVSGGLVLKVKNTRSQKNYKNVKIYSTGKVVSSGLQLRGGVIASGNSAYVSKGGVISAADVMYGAKLTVRSGGSAVNTVISGGRMYVSGRLGGTSVTSGGSVRLCSGAAASGITIGDGGRMTLSSYASASSVRLMSGAKLVLRAASVSDLEFTPFAAGLTISSKTDISCSESMRGCALGRGGALLSSSSALKKKTLKDSMTMYVFNGGKASKAKIVSGGKAYIFNGGSALNTSVASGGYLYVGKSGTLSKCSVASGGTLILKNKSVLSGSISMGGTLKAYTKVDASNAVLTVRADLRRKSDTWCISGFSKIKNAELRMTVNVKQATGTYRIASGVKSFSSCFIVSDTSGRELGALWSGDSFTYGARKYKLVSSGAYLSLKVSKAASAEAVTDISLYSVQTLAAAGTDLAKNTSSGTIRLIAG